MGLEHTYSGLRVLDLSENIAGPLACMILGDLGADVVKVERTSGGDSTRDLTPRWGDESTVFLAMNRNKRSVAVDLRSEAAQAAVAVLAKRADVVVESFRPGVAEQLGWDGPTLLATNPSLVHCSISAFGRGPIGRDRGGYDGLIQAFTGIMAMTGEARGEPCRAAPSVVDVSTGLWATTAIMAALARRATTGTGEHLEVTLVDSGFFLLGHQLMGLLATGEAPGRLGSAAPSAAPNQAVRTADARIMIATSTDRLFRRLCDAVGLPDLPADPRFCDPAQRIANREELATRLEERLATQPASRWLTALADAGVPASTVNTLAQGLADPLTEERRLLSGTDEGRVPDLEQLRLPIDTASGAPRRQPPALGQHTEEVLAELGIDRATIDAILDAGGHQVTAPPGASVTAPPGASVTARSSPRRRGTPDR